MRKPFLTGCKRHNPPGFEMYNFSIFILILHYKYPSNKKLRTLRRLTKPEGDFSIVQFFFIHRPCRIATKTPHEYIREHTSNIRIHTGTYEQHTNNIRVHTSTYEKHTSNIRVHTSIHTSKTRALAPLSTSFPKFS